MNNTLNITHVRISRFKDKGNFKAYVTLTIANSFMIHGLRIIEGKDGLFLTMPSKKVGDEFKDVAHPISKEVKEEVEALVFAEYNKGE